MTSKPSDSPGLPLADPQILQDPKLALGFVALLGWFVALTMTDFAHDALGIADAGVSAHGAAHAVYEIASGYVLGFVAAVAAALLGGLLRGDDADPAIAARWLRWLVAAALFIVVLACIAGGAVHNADGVTLLYDIAFAAGLVVVFAGVVPLHKHLLVARRP